MKLFKTISVKFYLTKNRVAGVFMYYSTASVSNTGGAINYRENKTAIILL